MLYFIIGFAVTVVVLLYMERTLRNGSVAR